MRTRAALPSMRAGAAAARPIEQIERRSALAYSDFLRDYAARVRSAPLRWPTSAPRTCRVPTCFSCGVHAVAHMRSPARSGRGTECWTGTHALDAVGRRQCALRAAAAAVRRLAAAAGDPDRCRRPHVFGRVRCPKVRWRIAPSSPPTPPAPCTRAGSLRTCAGSAYPRGPSFGAHACSLHHSEPGRVWDCAIGRTLGMPPEPALCGSAMSNPVWDGAAWECAALPSAGLSRDVHT